MWLEKTEGNALIRWITFCSGCGFALFGYDQGVFGGLLGNESFIRVFDNPDAILQGHITATFDLGCFITAMLTMWWGNKIGSRRNILFGCIILIVGAILQSAAYSVAQLILGRLIAGFGNGMITASIPVWQSETTPAGYRGRIMVLQLVVNQVGNVMSQWINYGMTFIAGSEASWRFPLAFQCFFAILVIIPIPWLPDSPRWLVIKDRNEEAYEIMRRLAGPQSEQETRESFQEIQQSVRHEMSLGKITVRSLFTNDSIQTTRRLILGAGTQLMQQWSGINAVLYYFPVVFASIGLSRNLSLILAACNAMNLMFSACVGALYIDTFGRKRLMALGAAGQSLCFVFVTVGLAMGGNQWDIVAISFIFGYITVFGLSWIAVPWMYPAEVNTQRMRIAGSGVATAANWINNYVVVLITPVGTANLGWRYYIIFAVLNAVFVPVVLMFYLETANLSLEEIDTRFEQKFSKVVDDDHHDIEKSSSKEAAAEHVSVCNV
ncbi:hexose carrier protein [Annulohypoxylon truncatum]|uniref:hexose carrier protein n=1 Tax=Annulohypoxylon truncatum TaxID=327061 RepID=UPI0020076BD5|nr:hexose carrier protein [Annulohypoxylon truncatum]KAI1212067.1 hexose carrier protein [Annulohypoxylon truncatum]